MSTEQSAETPKDSSGPDVYAVALGDWRCATTFWVTGVVGGPTIENQAAHQVTTLRTPARHTTFVTPSATALHLNSGWRLARQAVDAKARLRWRIGSVIPGVQDEQSTIEEATDLFDFFELAMSSAMSSYAAVEAFCNSVVVEKSKGPFTLKRRNGVETMSAEEVERMVSTDEKLKRIVPGLLGCPTPSGKAIWQRYVALKGIRDSVTHFKRKDLARHANESHEPTALQDLLNADPFTYPETAMAVIEYFYKDGLTPRWMKHPSWNRTPTGT